MVLTWSKTVTGFDMSDITASGGAFTDFTEDTAGLVYTINFTPTAGGTGSVALVLLGNRVSDTAGNMNAAASIIFTIGDIPTSAAPNLVDLLTDSQSNFRFAVGNQTDNITNDNTPEFRVSGVASGASVVITATRSGQTDVIGSGMVGVSDASVDITLSTLAEGDWSVTAVQTAPGLVVSGASTPLSVTIDTVTPVISFTKNPDATPAPQKIYSATTTTDGTPVTMHIRGQGNNSCGFGFSSTVQSRGVAAYIAGSDLIRNNPADNDNWICFYATDLAGNSSVMFANQILGITPASGIPVVDLLSDSNAHFDYRQRNNSSNDTDNITLENVLEFEISGLVNSAVVELTATATGQTDVTVEGTVGAAATAITLTVGTSSAPLADGVWSVTAVQTSPSMATSTALLVTIDSTLPVITLTKNPDTATPGLSKTYAATATSGGTGGSAINMETRFQGSAACANPPPQGGANHYTPGTDIAAEQETNNGDFLCFYAIDVAGNAVFMATNEIGGIDRTGPTIALPATAEVQRGTTATIAVTVNEALGTGRDALAATDFTVTSGGTVDSVAAVSGSTNYTATFSAGGGTGMVSVSIAANVVADGLGNGNSASNVLVIDVVQAVSSAEPTLDLVAASDSRAYFRFLPPHRSHPSRDNDDITNDNTPTITVGNVVVGAEVVVVATHTDMTAVTMTVASATATSIDITVGTSSAPLKDGVWEIVATHTDGSNAPTDSAEDALSITIDATLPVVTIDKNPDMDPAMSKVYAASVTDDNDVVMYSRGDPNSGDVACAAEPFSVGNYTAGDDVTYDKEVNNGVYLCFYAIDTAGNTTRELANQVGGIDLTPPTVTVAPTDLVLGTATEVTFTWSEAVTGFALADIQADSFILFSDFVEVSDTVYTANAVDDEDDNVSAGTTGTLVLMANRVTDLAGNGNALRSQTVTFVEAPSAGPTVTLDFVGLTSGTKTCAASARADKGGVCEGDSIVFILTADPVPSANLVVAIGRLEAGQLTPSSGPFAGMRLDYGLPGDPYSEYIDNNEDDGAGHTITILANQATARYTLTTVNRYGASSVGGMYYEILDAPNNDYQHNEEDRGQFNAPTATANPSNCTTNVDAMSDNNEDSECLVVIHPVAAPVITLAAASTAAIAEGSAAMFALVSDKVPNHYNTARTALAALPISVTIAETGEVTSAASPMTVNIAAAGSTSFSVATDTDDIWEGSSSLSVDATVAASSDTPSRYSLGATVAGSVDVTDNDTVTVVMGADPADVTEGGTLMFTVEVATGELGVDMVLAYTVSGTATSGDFTAPSGMVTITAGSTDASIPVVTTTDSTTEAGGETVTITLTAPTVRGASLGTRTAATGTITDPTGPAPTAANPRASFSTTTLTVAEGGDVDITLN
ncbi:MAG: beta strand repeat-containing protein, partial [Pseudohongiellaceae bacterium]